MKAKVLVLNGPNLNMLGTRQTDIYGSTTLAEIEAAAQRHGKTLGLAVECRQSNDEGQLVSWIQKARGAVGGIVINPAGYGTTSVAILDALLTCDCPIVELHLSNIFRRDAFRHPTYVSRAARGVICGFGARGYLLALDAIAGVIAEASPEPAPKAARKPGRKSKGG